ncbi:MAG: DNA-3-methyladenine glycosylase 2 family protein [Pseudomonadota bacterium]
MKLVQRLTQRRFSEAVRELAHRDSDIKAIVERIGAPKPIYRQPGFASLAYIILEQQVSLASAKSTFEKLTLQTGPFTPTALLDLDDENLRSAGVSRQKARYLRVLARAVCDGTLFLEELERQSDEQVRAELTALTGIGDWTADVYLLMALRRPDLWPVGDLALVKAVGEIKGLSPRPDPSQLNSLGESYRPYRSVATRLYWHHYLNPE